MGHNGHFVGGSGGHPSLESVKYLDTKPTSWLYQNYIQKVDKSDFLRLSSVPQFFLMGNVSLWRNCAFVSSTWVAFSEVIMVFRYKTRAGRLSISKKTEKWPNISQFLMFANLYHREHGKPRFRHTGPGWGELGIGQNFLLSGTNDAKYFTLFYDCQIFYW